MFSRRSLLKARQERRERRRKAELQFRPQVERLEERRVMAVVSIVATDNTATEKDQTSGVFTISVDTPSPSGYTVSVTASGTATSYVPPLGSGSLDFLSVNTVFIPANASSTTYTITPYLDNLVEESETVIFTITSGAGYTVGTASATITIEDDPPIVTFKNSEVEFSETDYGSFSLSLTRSGGDISSGFLVTLEQSGDATPEEDFWIGDADDIEFYFAGYDTYSFIVMPWRDNDYEEDTEVAYYELVTDEEHYLISENPLDNVGTVTIREGTRFLNDAFCPICLCGCPAVQTGHIQQTGTFIAQVDGAGLRYLSAPARPIVTVDWGFGGSVAGAESVEARLAFNGGTPVSAFYDASGLTADAPYRFALQTDVSLPTGRYPWSMQIIEHYDGSPDVTHTVTGFQEIYNRAASPFGSGWSWLGLDELAIQEDGVQLMMGDGNLIWFTKNENDSYTVQDGDPNFSVLTLDEGIYTLTTRGGDVTLFGASGLELSKTDKFGNTTTFAYIDADGDEIDDEIATVTDPTGRETSFVWDEGVLDTITDFSGKTYTLEYDGVNLVGVTAPDPDDAGPGAAAVSSFTYDSLTGQMDSFSRPTGGANTLTYDFSGALASRTDASENTQFFTSEVSLGLVDPTGGLGSVEDPAPLIAALDIKGVTTSELDTDTTYTTDQFGGHLSETDALGNTTHYLRNAQGLVTRATIDIDGEGGEAPYVWDYRYDDFGNMTLSIGPGDAISEDRLYTSYTYDATWHVLTSEMSYNPSTFPSAPLSWTIYTLDEGTGAVLEVRRVMGLVDDELNEETDDAVETYTYTVAPTSEGDPPAGLVATYTDPGGFVTAYDYNELGLVIEIVQAVGTADEGTLQFEYDSAGNLTAEIDELGRRTEHTYDNVGNRLTTVLPDPDGPGEGNPLTSPVYSWQYNVMGRVILAVDALGREMASTYGAFGNLLSQTLSGDGFDDITTGSGYDDAGRLISQYDGLGRTTSYTLDAAGRTLFTTLPDPDGPGGGNPLTSPVYAATFDPLGRTATTTDALGNVTTVAYSFYGRTVITTLPDPDGSGGGNPLESPVLVQVFDAAGRLSQSFDARGGVTTYYYDMLGRRIQAILPDPDGSGVENPLASPVLNFFYDTASNLVAEEDVLGNFTYYAFDARHRLVEKVLPDPDGSGGGNPLTAPEYHWVYDAASQLISEEDPLGRITTHVLDNLGREIATILPDPDGPGGGNPLESPVWQFTFDAANRLLSTIAPNGGVTSYEYDLLDNVIRQVLPDPDGSGEGNPLTSPEYHWVYDAASQLVSEEDPLGRITLHNRDNLGREIETVLADPDGPGGGNPLESPVWRFSFDANSNLLSTFDPLNQETVNLFDNLGRKIKVTDAEAGETSYQFDSANNLLSLIDSVGNTTTWFYDQLNRVTQERNELGDSRYFQYDAGGHLVFKIDRNGRATQYEQDNLGRTTAENWLAGNWLTPDLSVATTTQGSGTNEVQRVGFTAGTSITMGTFTLSFGGQTTENIAYNASAATVQTALEGLSSIGSGNIAVTKTQNTMSAQEWTLTFQGALAGADQAQVTINSASVFGSPSISNIQATDTNGAAGTSEVEEITLAHAGSEGSFKLTFGGQTSGPIEFGASAAEVETALEGLASIGSGNVAVTSSTGGHWTVTFQGALANQNVAPLTASVIQPSLSADTTTPGGTVNEVQRVGVSASTSLSGGTFTLSFGGQTTSGIAYNASAATVQTALEGLSSIGSGNISVSKSQNTMNTQEWTLTFQGSLAGANQSQVTINSAGVSGMMSVSNTVLVATSSYSYDDLHRLTGLDHAQGATALAGYAYTFDAASRIHTVDSLADGLATFSYDATSQLTGADHASQPDEAHVWDANGNPFGEDFEVAADNTLHEDANFLYEHDAEGNLIKKTDKVTGDYVMYGWDYRNRLTSVAFYDSEDVLQKKVEYDYDLFDRRIAKRVDDDGDNDFDRAEKYVYDGEDIVLVFDDTGSLTSRFLHGPGADELFADERFVADVLDDVYYPLTDHLGSVRDVAVYDSVLEETSVAKHLTLDSFGKILTDSAPALPFLYAFTGREWDADADLYYYRARWFSPDMRRFISKDPIGFEAGDSNDRRYVGNNAANSIDPSGLDWIDTNGWYHISGAQVGLVSGPREINRFPIGNTIGGKRHWWNGIFLWETPPSSIQLSDDFGGREISFAKAQAYASSMPARFRRYTGKSADQLTNAEQKEVLRFVFSGEADKFEEQIRNEEATNRRFGDLVPHPDSAEGHQLRERRRFEAFQRRLNEQDDAGMPRAITYLGFIFEPAAGNPNPINFDNAMSLAPAASAALAGRCPAAQMSARRSDGVVANARGRRGSPTTRADVDVQRDAILKDHPDYVHTHGGTDAVTGAPKPELYVPGAGGGRKGSTYPDITFRKPDGGLHHHNTADTYADGVTLTKREAGNAGRLQTLRPNDTISTSPKPKP